MSFKARDVTLKYALLLKIGILALDQERAIYLLSKSDQLMWGSHLSGMPFSFPIIL